MTARTTSSYSTAARACAKAIRLPEQSRQRRTGQAVGDPQRAQSGGEIRGSPKAHAAQSWTPPAPQTTQRCGSSRSSTCRG
jgi:hypothetical protein